MGIVEAYKMAKQDMPPYLFRFTYRYTLYYFLLSAAAMIGGTLLGMAFSKKIANAEMLFMGGGIGLALFFTAMFLTKAYFVYKRLALETADHFEKEYSSLSPENAEQQLREERILDDTGFLYVVEELDLEPGVGKVLFENCKLYFSARYWVGKVYLSLVVLNDEQTEVIVAYNLLPALFCYLKEKDFSFVNHPTFLMFDRDKKRFFRILCKNSDSPHVNRIDKRAERYYKS